MIFRELRFSQRLGKVNGVLTMSTNVAHRSITPQPPISPLARLSAPYPAPRGEQTRRFPMSALLGIQLDRMQDDRSRGVPSQLLEAAREKARGGRDIETGYSQTGNARAGRASRVWEECAERMCLRPKRTQPSFNCMQNDDRGLTRSCATSTPVRMMCSLSNRTWSWSSSRF